MSLVANLIALAENVAADIKTWLRIKNTRSVLLASSQSIGTNADHNWLVLSLAANTLQVGDTIDFDFFGTFTHGTSGSGNLNFWTKLNGVKSQALLQPFTAPTFSNRPLLFTGQAVVRAIGTNGLLQLCYSAQLSTSTPVILLSVPVAINTLDANTLTVGCNLSVTGAANITYAEVGSIRLLW